MLWRGDDGSLIYERDAAAAEWFVETKLALIIYMSDGSIITYRPDPLRLPPPEHPC
jgi:hypothetical protein